MHMKTPIHTVALAVSLLAATVSNANDKALPWPDIPPAEAPATPPDSNPADKAKPESAPTEGNKDKRRNLYTWPPGKEPPAPKSSGK